MSKMVFNREAEIAQKEMEETRKAIKELRNQIRKQNTFVLAFMGAFVVSFSVTMFLLF